MGNTLGTKDIIISTTNTPPITVIKKVEVVAAILNSDTTKPTITISDPYICGGDITGEASDLSPAGSGITASGVRDV